MKESRDTRKFFVNMADDKLLEWYRNAKVAEIDAVEANIGAVYGDHSKRAFGALMSYLALTLGAVDNLIVQVGDTE